MENMKRLLEFAKPRTGKKITFYTKQYFVTSGGMVYDGTRKKFLMQTEIKKYMHVTLCDDEGVRHASLGVHVLVVSVFQRLLCNGEVVHHINHIRDDNRLENLQILTASEHQRQHVYENWQNGTMDRVGEMMKKAWKAGRIKTRNVGNDYNPAKPVVQLTLDGKLVKVWPSTMECGRNGYNFGTVAACCRGKHKTHKGFKWMYLSDYEAQKDKETSHLEQLVSS